MERALLKASKTVSNGDLTMNHGELVNLRE
jgi:hypothetical protein